MHVDLLIDPIDLGKDPALFNDLTYVELGLHPVMRLSRPQEEQEASGSSAGKRRHQPQVESHVVSSRFMQLTQLKRKGTSVSRCGPLT